MNVREILDAYSFPWFIGASMGVGFVLSAGGGPVRMIGGMLTCGASCVIGAAIFRCFHDEG